MVAHHPQSSFRPTDWFFHAPLKQRFVEIYSLHGRSEYYANPNPITSRTPPNQKYSTRLSVINVRNGSVQHALKQHYQIGILGGGDKHDGHPGDLGLAAVYATGLTREEIFDGLYQRRAFGTTNARMVVDFQIDGQMMGKAFVSDSPPEITASAIGTQPISKLELLRNDEIIHTHQGSSHFETFSMRDTDLLPAKTYYYLRVHQSDGEMAWSSPIWVESGKCDLSLEFENARRPLGTDKTDNTPGKTGSTPLTKERKRPQTDLPVEESILFVVRNLGQGDCLGSKIAVYDETASGKMLLWSESVGKISGDEAKTVVFPVSKDLASGVHILRANIDDKNQLQEVDESNNSLEFRHLVPGRVIYSNEKMQKTPGGKRYFWKKIPFETGRETIRIDGRKYAIRNQILN